MADKFFSGIAASGGIGSFTGQQVYTGACNLIGIYRGAAGTGGRDIDIYDVVGSPSGLSTLAIRFQSSNASDLYGEPYIDFAAGNHFHFVNGIYITSALSSDWTIIYQTL